MTKADFAAAVFLAYYSSGMTLIAFHSGLLPLDQPGYVSLGWPRKMLAGALWPFTAYFNDELGWNAICFFASIPMFAIAWWVTGRFVGGFWQALLTWLFSFTRVARALCAAIALPIWLVLAKPLGLRMPIGMDRPR